MALYKKFDVELQFRDMLFGVQPKTEELIEQYVQAKGLSPEKARELRETVDLADEEQMEEQVKKSWVGFLKDDKGLYKRDYQVKGMIKQAARVLKITTQARGSLNLIRHGLFVKPKIIYLGKEKPDGHDDKSGTVSGQRGERSILTRADYVEKPKMAFQVWVLDNGVLSDENLRTILEHCQEMGFGGRKTYEEGKFDLIKFEKVGNKK